MASYPFFVGQVYHRQHDLHGPYRGQQQGGISTPQRYPYVFLFTGEGGEQYGYVDDVGTDDTFWYTGEGQVGDMTLVRGNEAIVTHRDRGKHLLLFRYVSKGHVRFEGEFEYVSHHTESRPDRNGKLRNVLVFHLGLLPPETVFTAALDPSDSLLTTDLPKHVTLAQLRTAALTHVSSAASPVQRQVNVRRRAAAIKRYAFQRANGVCEGCQSAAPFQTKTGPFLEVHHVHQLGDGGPDHPAHVIALCPNCHRRAHYATDAKAFNDGLIAWLNQREDIAS